jgi:hypothetical protein
VNCSSRLLRSILPSKGLASAVRAYAPAFNMAADGAISTATAVFIDAGRQTAPAGQCRLPVPAGQKIAMHAATNGNQADYPELDHLASRQV